VGIREGLFVSGALGDDAAMKTIPHTQVPHGHVLTQQKARTYSLLETAHVLGLPLSDLREILKKHALHPEPGFRGERISRREVLSYVSRHPTRLEKAVRGMSV
jgi:hypothetical protein